MPASAQIQSILEIPLYSEWTNRGVVLTAGPPGSWDVRLNGMISPCAIIKKNATYYLYYIGVDGTRPDLGPNHRALGVATSSDGINFTKYSGNPIITFLPNNNIEEGVFSAGAALDENGNFILYYGAMNAGTPTSTSVHSDVRLAVSNDGFNFIDLGIVLSYNDNNVWGSGDELFPLGTFHYDGNWYLYYNNENWDLGLAWGPNPDELDNTQAVLTAGSDIIGGCDPVWVGQDEVALFIVRNFSENYIETRTAQVSSPGQLSSPVMESYLFPGFRHLTIFFDVEENTWFMYHRTVWLETNTDLIHLRTAPGNADPPLPVTLSSFTASTFNKSVKVNWVTESEVENLGFILERRENTNSDFIEIASYITDNQLSGQGYTTKQTKYEYIDKNVYPNIDYEYQLSEISYSGKRTYHEPISIRLREDSTLPLSIDVFQTFPNPFNSIVTIRFTLSIPVNVSIKIFNAAGEKIKTLIHGHKKTGVHQVKWDSRNDEGGSVGSGIYLVNIQAGDLNMIKKIILLK